MTKKGKRSTGRFWWLAVLAWVPASFIGQSLAFGEGIVSPAIHIAIMLPLCLLGMWLFRNSAESDKANQIGTSLRDMLLPWPRSAVLLVMFVAVELLVSIPLFAFTFYPCSGPDIVRRMNGCVAIVPDSKDVIDISISRDGSRLAVADVYGSVKVWSYPDLAFLSDFQGDWSWLGQVALTSDGDLVAFGGYGDPVIRIGDTRTGNIVYTLTHNSESHGNVLFTPDDEMLISLSGSGVQIWDFERGEMAQMLPHDNVDDLALTADGGLLVSANSRGQIKVWQLADGKNILTLEQPFLQDIAVSPNGQYIVAAVWDLEGRVDSSDEADTLLNYWSIEQATIERTVVQPDVHVSEIAISRDGASLAGDTGSCRKRSVFDKVCMLVWTIEGGSQPKGIRLPGTMASAEFSPTANELFAATYTGDLLVWQIP